MIKDGEVKQILKDFLAGDISVALALTVLSPFQLNKICLPSVYTGIVEKYILVLEYEGVLAFWRGNLTNIVRYFPIQAINFSVKDALNRKLVGGIDAKDRPYSNLRFFCGTLLRGGIA